MLGIDTASGGVMLCVVQGQYDYRYRADGGASRSHDVNITTVQVHTERTPDGKMKPVRIGHVDIGTSFADHEDDLVRATSYFAVG